MKYFALTGGIATGKSTVANLFKFKGFSVFDADKLSREVVKPGSKGLNSIIKEFGQQFLNKNGALNRRMLSKEIFSNENSRILLENIMHPLISELLKIKIDKSNNLYNNLIIYEASLIFEKNIQTTFNAVVLTICNEKIRLKRLMSRDNISELEAKNLINAQMPQYKKIKLAKYIIDTSFTFKQTKSQFQHIYNLLIKLKNKTNNHKKVINEQKA